MENESKYLIERKFIVTLLSIGLASLMLWNKLIPAESYSQIVIWCSGIFVVGQVASNWVQMLGTKTDVVVVK